MNIDQMLAQTRAREPGFRLMIQHLQSLPNPLIVETGCARQADDFIGDGQSTVIFDAVANQTNGQVISVDIDPAAVAFAQSCVSAKTVVHCADSVNFLWTLNGELSARIQFVDLLYLDSFDLDVNDPTPSAQHHLKELTAIISRLRPGSLIVVDDNFMWNGKFVGKASLIAQFMKSIGKPLLFEGYQFVWKF